MQALPYTGGLGVLLRDHGVGEVRTGRDGEPVLRYRLTPADVEHMRRGVRGAARVAEAMGARRIYSSHSKWVAYEPGRAGDVDGGQVWSTPGLYVFDGAAFPTASGVNPMVTIEALAHMNARALAARLA